MKNLTKFIWHNIEHFGAKEISSDFQDIKENLNMLKQSVEISPEKIRGEFLELARTLRLIISDIDKDNAINIYHKTKTKDLPNGFVIEEENNKANSVYNKFDSYRYIYYEGEEPINLLKTKYGIMTSFYENPRKNEKGVVILLSKDPFGPLNEEMTTIKLVNQQFYLDNEPITPEKAKTFFPEIEKRIQRLREDLNSK